MLILSQICRENLGAYMLFAKKANTTAEMHAVVVTEKAFKVWDYPLFILLTGLSFSTILYFMWHWFSLKDWSYYPGTFSMMTFILAVKLLNNQSRWFLLPLMRKPIPMKPRTSWKVGVVTTFVPDAEPLEMLEETAKALIALDYPHDTWILDEGDDDQVKALCQRLGARHFSRKNLPQYQMESGPFQSCSRHGNYNAWLYDIGFDRYDIITQFDPDHVPEPSFLSQVLGYFEDPRVGYVQVAQAYYNQKASFIARGAAEETYAHYSSTQMASYAMGYTIIIGGHSTHRVTALKNVGGFAAHDADDILITFFYHNCGWQGVYVPQILARGLTPVDWGGYLTQQLKWARSVLDIKLRIYPRLLSDLSFKTRTMSLLHGLSYLESSLIVCMGLILTTYMLISGSTPNVVSYLTILRLATLCAVLLLCDFYRQRFYLDWRSEWGLRWRATVLQYAKWPYLILAFYQVILDRKASFPINPKIKVRSWHYIWLWPHLVVVVVLGTAWVSGMISGHVIHPLLHIWTALVVTGSLILALTESINFPEPYDKNLRNRQPKSKFPMPFRSRP
jgi:cellulose synthase (UDP-forming)